MKLKLFILQFFRLTKYFLKSNPLIISLHISNYKIFIQKNALFRTLRHTSSSLSQNRHPFK